MIPFQHGVFATAAGAVAGFESIATVTATGGETSLTFSSIPQGYASLQIRGISRSTGSGSYADTLYMQLNGVTTATYAEHFLRGGYTTGAYVAAAGYVSQTSIILGLSVSPRTGNDSSMYGCVVVDLHDYASTSRNKTVRSYAGYDVNASGEVSLNSGLYPDTAAVSSLTMLTVGANAFAAGTTFALYGIKGAA